MSTEFYRCTCTHAAADHCACDETFVERDAEGCNCSCHAEYSDDPENWQPVRISTRITDAEFAEMADWLARMDAAEALTEEQP